MILRVAPHQVPDWWPLVEGWVEAACAHDGLHTAASTRAEVTRGETVLWLIFAPGLVACAVTEVRTSPGGRSLAWCIIGGKGAAEWFGELDATLTSYGLANGCTRAFAWGRRGWQPMVAPHGWSPTSTIYQKELMDV